MLPAFSCGCFHNAGLVGFLDADACSTQPMNYALPPLVYPMLSCWSEFLANDGDVRALVGSGDKSDLAVDRLSTRGFFVTDGYNNKQIFSNMQFKLGLALREAGLHGSDAARQAMMSLAQPRQGSVQLG